jgi:hypothetical protein
MYVRPVSKGEFANCTSETVKASSFLAANIFLLPSNRPSFYSFQYCLSAVLPDSIFSNKKSQFGLILECLAMNDVGKFMTIWSILRIFYCHLVYFVVILVYFFKFWYVTPRKILQPCLSASLVVYIMCMDLKRFSHFLNFHKLLLFMPDKSPCFVSC